MKIGFGRGLGHVNSIAAVLEGGVIPPPEPVLPEPIGTIYNGSSLSDWLVPETFTGTVNIVQDGSDIVMSGTGGTGGTNASNLFQDFLLLNLSSIISESAPYGDLFNFHCLPQWTIEIDFTTGTINQADSYGYSSGVISTNSYENRDSLCRWAMDSGFLGRIYWYYKNTSATGTQDQTAPTGGSAMSNSTLYKMVFEQDYLTFTTTIYDSLGNVVNTKTTTDATPGVPLTKVHHNTGRFAIAQHGGTTRIHNIHIYSNALKNVPYLAMTTSLGYGGKATSLANSYPHLAFAGLDYTVLPGWANRAVDMDVIKGNIKAINPQNLIIETGSNDIAAGTWATTGQDALDSIIAYANANTNANIFLMSAGARDDFDTIAVQDYMNTLGYPVSQVYSRSKNDANYQLRASYEASVNPDGIHWGNTGHSNEADALKTLLGI